MVQPPSKNLMTAKKLLEKVLTDPNYVGGVQWWIRKHDAMLEMNLRLVATIPPRPADNRNRDQESWDAKYSFLLNGRDEPDGGDTATKPQK